MLSPHRTPMPKLIFVLLCLYEAALSAAPKVRLAPVVKNEVASGLYKPSREASEKICSTLPSLTELSLEVSESGGQQVDLASARVGDQLVEMRKKSPLTLREFAHKSKRCFNFKANTPSGLSEAGEFMRNVFKLLGEDERQQLALQLAFCETQSGLLVGIGLRKNGKGSIIGFEHIFSTGPAGRGRNCSGRAKASFTAVRTDTRRRLGSTDYVCSTLPLLTSFVMKVWEYDGQQVAKMTATVADRPVGMAEGVRLACYGDSFVRRLNFTQYGFPKKKPENCFRFLEDERDVVEKFMRGLYTAMGEPLTRRQDSSIVICKCTSIILVGMILETKRHRTRGFKNILFLDGPLAIAAHEQIDSVAPCNTGESFGSKKRTPIRGDKGWGMSAAGEFVRDLYRAMGEEEPHQAATHLAFCKVRLGLLVFLGPKWSGGRITSFKGVLSLIGPSTSPTSAEGYKAVRNGTDKVCPTLPLLTDFEVTVWEDGGQQVATINAKVADEVVRMTRNVRLVWYSGGQTRRRELSRYGLPKKTSKRCFHFVEQKERPVLKFMHDFYGAMKKVAPKFAHAHLAFCPASSKILVGIGLQKATTDDRLTGFENAFFISKVEKNLAEGDVPRLSSSPPVGSRSRKRKSSSETAVAAKKRSTSREEPSGEMARRPASDISDFVPDWLLDDDLEPAAALEVKSLWKNSQPTEVAHAAHSPGLSLAITEDTMEDEENPNVQAGPPPTHSIVADGSPAPTSLFFWRPSG
ncbi:hypothetical protein FOZ60_015113 [Perkinsus olseni]|uniref:Uncharacterized protein n=1 Tax=Perkinsus olseni TaxID=32597 RepID=A0A7J6P6I7_PEROL|nr:hypothetical protein FOZ60_015113 [Perkinsus olseni]